MFSVKNKLLCFNDGFHAVKKEEGGDANKIELPTVNANGKKIEFGSTERSLLIILYLRFF